MLAPVKPREVLSDVLAVGGLAALCTAAWLWAPLAGLAATGAALLFLAWAIWAAGGADE